MEDTVQIQTQDPTPPGPSHNPAPSTPQERHNSSLKQRLTLVKPIDFDDEESHRETFLKTHPGYMDTDSDCWKKVRAIQATYQMTDKECWKQVTALRTTSQLTDEECWWQVKTAHAASQVTDLECWEQVTATDAVLQINSNNWEVRARTAAKALEIEKQKYERVKQASRQLQAQMNGYGNSILRAREQIQGTTNTNIALTQEILRLRCTVETLNGVLRMICDHSTCGNGDDGIKAE